MVTDEVAESLGLDTARGALVADVTPDGPAKASGIQAGDVILKFAGQDVSEMRELPRIVAETEVGKTVSVEVWRHGEGPGVTAKLGALEAGEQSRSQQEPPGADPGPARAPGWTAPRGLGRSTPRPPLRGEFKKGSTW